VSKRQRAPTRSKDVEAQTVTMEAGPPTGEGAKRAGRPPWDKSGPAEGSGSFGEWLRRQREMREISLRDIADRTKISLRYLEAMEADRFDLLPAPIFAKGFLREYARYVGLSADEVVNHYLAVHQPEEVDQPGDATLVAMERKRRKKGRSWTWGLFLLLAGALLLALVALVSWLVDKREDEPAAVPPQVAAPQPAAPQQLAVPPAAPAAPKAPLEVTLDFSANCWVRVTVDGKPAIEEERVQGESLQFEAQKSIAVKLGNAAAADIQVNGYPLEFDQSPGKVVEIAIDLETVRALREKREAR
jgi:cytoskeleton protein RodZ